MTGTEIELIDLCYRAAPLEPGDVILLASDGINTLESDAIARSIAACEGKSAATIAKQLLDDVEACGELHQDNTTIVAIRVLPDGPAPLP